MKRTATGTALALALAFLVAGFAGPAMAHPLGNFTINHFSRIEAYSDTVRLHWVLDMAEVPTFQEMAALDPDGDGSVSESERARYLAATVPGLIDDLAVTLGGRPLPLALLASDLALLDAQAGLKSLRITLDLEATTGAGAGALRFEDATYADRLGWREIVVVAGTGVPVDGVAVPAASVSEELRAYPDDLLSSPLDVRSTTFSYRGGVGQAAPAFHSATVVSNPTRPGGVLEDLLSADNLTPPIVVLAMLVAFGLGAVHALSPGHGKTIVAAYFVGNGGTARQALFLALTVTLAHTAGVLALGAVTLWASEYIVPEDLYPALTLGSGLVLVGFGAVMLVQWALGRRRTSHHHDQAEPHVHHDHHHGHGHEHGHAQGLSALEHARAHLAGRTAADGLPWRSLLTLGISGGILPSPTALVVLLGAISLHRLGFGLALIFMFSAGLATVLTGVGLAFVVARRLLGRVRGVPALAGYAPVAGAFGVAAAGALLAARGLLAL